MKKIKASEIEITGELQAAISKTLVPIEQWENIQNVDVHVESRVGSWISGLEHILQYAYDEGNLELARVLLKDLIGMSKYGKAKAELTVLGQNKLRPETDLSTIDLEALKRATGRE